MPPMRTKQLVLFRRKASITKQAPPLRREAVAFQTIYFIILTSDALASHEDEQASKNK